MILLSAGVQREFRVLKKRLSWPPASHLQGISDILSFLFPRTQSLDSTTSLETTRCNFIGHLSVLLLGHMVMLCLTFWEHENYFLFFYFFSNFLLLTYNVLFVSIFHCSMISYLFSHLECSHSTFYSWDVSSQTMHVVVKVQRIFVKNVLFSIVPYINFIAIGNDDYYY